MKSLCMLLCGVVLCGVTLSTSPVQAQNEADWARLGIGIADAIIRSSNQNNNRWGNPGVPTRSAPSYEPGQTSNNNFNSFNNNPFNQPNNNWNRPSNNWNRPSNNTWVQPSNNNWNRPSTTYRPSTPNYEYYDSPRVAPKVYSKKPIVIHCPSWCDGTCSYSIIGASGKEYVYSISPGEKQEFRETTDWKIKYNRGGGRGYKTYKLHGGEEYELHSDGDGEWAFYTSRGS